jgi:hypothetical protein
MLPATTAPIGSIRAGVTLSLPPSRRVGVEVFPGKTGAQVAGFYQRHADL